MANCEFLFWYGLFTILLTGCFILVPYLRGKADLISAWNILLVGVAIFIGIGCIEASTTPMRFPGLQWFEPTQAEVARYLSSTSVFLVALFASYYFDPVSRAVARRTLNKWPPDTTPVALYVIVVCIALVGAFLIPAIIQTTFIGPVVVNVAHKALVFACVFSFLLWYRNRINPVWLLFAVAVMMGLGLVAMLAGHGRRILLSVFMSPVLVIYYYHARNWRPTRGVIVVATATLAVFILNLMYSAIRHYDWVEKHETRSATELVKRIRNIGSANWFERFANDSLFHFSQQNVHYGMLTDHYVRTGQLEPQPFNTFKFFFLYPIPRSVWPEKPQVLANIIVRDVVKAQTNWGTGVAGQAAFEGGLLVAAMFGYMAAFGVRLFDDPLRRQPTNPFLIAMLAAAGPHLLGWARGDLFTMTMESAECVFFVVALGISARILFGTQRASLPMFRHSLHMRPV